MSGNTSELATLGGGCFWCLDAAYRRVRGVERSVVGYAGGSVVNPTYELVASGTTGHAEVVQLTFNPREISYETILDIFWTLHDPTTKDRQGHDIGREYRSLILTHSAEQQKIAEASREKAQKLWPDPIVTEILPLETFYPAEDYEQDYFNTHPEQAYCQIVINPKLHKLQERFAGLVRR